MAAIARLYRQLEALRITDRPSPAHTRRGSPAYRALEAQIAALAARHTRLTADE